MNEEQIAILKQRQERFKKLGLPTTAGQITENTVVNTGANPNVHHTLSLIKKGALANNFKKFIDAEAKGNSANAGYQIPEPKVGKKNRNHPNAPKVDPVNKVEIQSFAPQSSNSEAEMIEKMFGGGGAGYSTPSINMNDTIAQRPMNNELDFESINSGMPTFNPMAHLQKKIVQKQSIRNPMAEEFISETPQAGQPQLSYTYLKEMMKDIAKEISEKTIKEVLKEYSDNYANKKTFEVYNKEQNVIKTSDGKYYKLTPVTIKKKVE